MMEPYKNPALPPEKRAEDLLSRMTLREKIGQLTQRLYGFQIYQRCGDDVTLTDTFYDEVAHYGGLGTIYGLYRADPWSGKDFETGLDGVLAPKIRNRIQQYVMEHSRFGIPVLMSTECPHGHQALDGCLLPVNLAAGATFAPQILADAAAVAARQLKQMGVDLSLISMLDVLRDPRWGRSEECYSEDPYLVARMGEAVVKAVQQEGVDVVAKHLCAQGETTGGINASAARIGQRELREIHLPPVKACVDAGVSAFMAAYNEIDGMYCHGNHWLLTELLRGEYGFDGFVMSDGCAINELDAVTGDRTASGALALNAGVDMGLWDTGFQKLEEAVERGWVETWRIDEAARRILTVKFRRGLFEHPFVPEDNQWQTFCAETSPEIRTLAEQSVILLKNEGNLLPLDVSVSQRLMVTGPNADSIYHQLGDYTPPLRPGIGITPLQGIRSFLSERNAAMELIFAPGCGIFDGDEILLSQAETAAYSCNTVIAVLGGTSSRFVGGDFMSNGAMKKQSTATMDCGEGIDDAVLRLPGKQLELLQRLKGTGRRVITVLIGGRPYEMGQIASCSDAILCAFYPGLTGGDAIARLIFGAAEPAGRLPVSLPDWAGQLPVYYNSKDSYHRMAYYNSEKQPQYGFGCGLSYTAFQWELVSEPSETERCVVIRVTNTGERCGWAVPQLYLHRKQGITTARRRQLCAFEKVWLLPGETATLSLHIPEESLIQWDAAGKAQVPHGQIEWFVADSGTEYLTGSLNI